MKKFISVMLVLFLTIAIIPAKRELINAEEQGVKGVVLTETNDSVRVEVPIEGDETRSVDRENLIDPSKVDATWNLNIIDANEEIKLKDTAKKVKIAIIDSGIDECDGITVEKRINLVPLESKVYPCFDDLTGHGTSVAGVIKGSRNADRESYGINENVDIVSIKVMDSDNTAPMDRIIEGIYKAIDENVNILNMSFGTASGTKELHAAIKAAKKAGILMIASAGKGNNVEYPAAYKEVIAVGSVGADGKITSDTPSGNQVEIYAPGEYIKSAASFGLETVCTGTSMSAPHVTGVASVLWQKDLSKSAEFIRGLLSLSVTHVKNDNIEYGILDEKYALAQYNEYRTAYKKSDGDIEEIDIEENNERLDTDKNQIKVEARWSKDNHEALVVTNKNNKLTNDEVKMIRAGIRYNDENLPGANNSNESALKYSRRGWHALTQNNNYMVAVSYVGQAIRTLNSDNTFSLTGFDKVKIYNNSDTFTEQFARMTQDIKDITASKVENTGVYADGTVTLNIKKKRLLLFGMELHIITDAFAHRSYGIISNYLGGNDPNHWIRVKNESDDIRADTVSYYKLRYIAAGQVVKNAMNQCLVFENGTVVMKKTKNIGAKQIAYNTVFIPNDPTSKYRRFALYKLYNYAEANKNNDSTFEEYGDELLSRTYSD